MGVSTALALAGGGGLIAGAGLMYYAAKQQQQNQQAVAAYQATLPGALPSLVQVQETPSTSTASSLTDAQGNSTTSSSTNTNGTLNNGWIYFVTIVTTSTDPTSTAGQSTIATTLQGYSLVDPTSKGAPTVTGIDATHGQALTMFTGTTGTQVPASTADFMWGSVLGYPAPEGLSTTSTTTTPTTSTSATTPASATTTPATPSS